MCTDKDTLEHNGRVFDIVLAKEDSCLGCFFDDPECPFSCPPTMDCDGFILTPHNRDWLDVVLHDPDLQFE